MRPRQYVADRLLAKAAVIRAMHDRVQVCQNPYTEFALLRENLGVSRISHILRVQGHTILREAEAANIFDHGGQRSLERRFPRTSHAQRTLWSFHCSQALAKATFAGATGQLQSNRPPPPFSRLSLLKAAQAADELWQAVPGHNGPTVTNPTAPEIGTEWPRLTGR